MIRWTGLTMLGFALAVTLTIAQDDAKGVKGIEKQVAKAEDELQGTWVLVASEVAGKRHVITGPEKERARISFSGNRSLNTSKGKTTSSTFRVDATKRPKTIDFVSDNVTIKGIYEVEGEVLRLCMSPEERPGEFKSSGLKVLVAEYKRVLQDVEPVKGNPAPKEENAVDDKTQELIERVKKNMAESEGRLDKKDPYDDTRQIQRDIIKDLDELIEKQNQNDQNNSGGGGGGASSNDKSGGGSSGKSGRRSKANQGGQANKGGAKGGQDQAKNDGKGGQDQDPKGGKGGQHQGKNGKDQAKNDGKGGQDHAKSDGKGGKNGKSGGGQGGNGTKGKNTIADLFKDIWGHLPQTKRMEMDAYSKERFMPKYDDLLRQYYRTIAEQGRKREGD
jgi:uncharacterized protein (TIGR03067 family)